ncbi:MAG: DUF4373 domain-containing protein [Clostridiales bacterium]|nr:DUF4373 domain-containing protein [Clostridiales bacterium]
MSRSIQNGLIYFSFDCDFFSNRKIKVLKANFGVDGIIVYVYLLCEIYKNGYYLKLDNDYGYIISDDLNLKPEKISSVISFFAEHCLFDKQLFLSDKILTSKGIQKRFQLAIRERAKKTPRTVNNYWLLDASETVGYISNDYNSRKKEDFSRNYDTKKRKEIKENKLNESKGKENENKETKSLVVVVDFYKQNINSDVKDIEISEIQSWLNQGFDEQLIIECIKISVLNNKRSTNYISGILNNMRKNSIMTFEDYQKPKQGKKEKGDVNNDQSEQYGNYY